MAILIPSKNIYQKQNKKVVNNEIRKIEINAYSPFAEKEYDGQVFSDTYDTTNLWDMPIGTSWGEYVDITDKFVGQDFTQFIYNTLGHYYGLMLFCATKPIYKTISLELPKSSVDKYIENIKYGQENGKNRIKHSVRYREVEGQYVTVTASLINGTTYSVSKITSVTEDISSIEPNIGTLPEINVSISHILPDETEYSAKTEVTNEENISTAKIEYDKVTDKYTINLTILCGLAKLTAGKGNSGGGSLLGSSLPNTVTLEGEMQSFIPVSVDVNLYGDIITLSLTDELLEYPKSYSNKVFSVDSNELMQTTNYYPKPFPISDLEIEYYYDKSFEKGKVKFADNTPRDFDVEIKVNIIDKSTNSVSRQTILKIYKGNTDSNSISLGGARRLQIVQTNDVRHNALINTFSSTLNEYISGKETATILCDINDYYEFDGSKIDFKGNKVIDILTPTLPEGYLPCRYVYFDNYHAEFDPIRTGVYGEARWEIKCYLDAYQYYMPFFNGYEEVFDGHWGAYEADDDDRILYSAGGNVLDEFISVGVRNITHNYEGRNKFFSVEGGGTIELSTSDVSSSEYTLFGWKNGGFTYSCYGMEIYECKAYKNGQLIRHFIPCAKDDNPEYGGLYDLVEGKYYTSTYDWRNIKAAGSWVTKKTFELYDEVVPMVFGKYGKDVPLSKYRDGTPKIFKVLGVRTYFDGAVWQELTLQEVTKGG